MSADHTYISSGGEDDVSRVCPVFRAILGGDETIVLRVNSLPLYKMDSTPKCLSGCNVWNLDDNKNSDDDTNAK